MSLLKIRDMSLLATPPIACRAIRTVIGEYEDAVVARAIREEVGREARSSYLHNRIETLDEVVSRLSSLLPDVMIASAHGQMNLDRTRGHDAHLHP